MKLPISCEPLDAMLRGGIECDTLTQVYGEAGSGKTNLCIQLTVNVCRAGKKAIFIDTEGISAERLKQIAGDDIGTVTKNMILTSPNSLTEQSQQVEKAIKLADIHNDIGLFILDSATLYHRLERALDNDIDENKLLVQQLTHMLRLARRREVPVVITNQVYTDPDTNTFRPLGGRQMDHLAKAIIKLEKMENGKRRAILMKHRSIPEGEMAVFRLTENGLE